MRKDKSSLIPLVICGVPFHNLTFEEATDWIIEQIGAGKPANVVTANLDFLTQAWRDPELQRIMIDADLVLADGFPMVKLSPFFGPKLKGRVTGADLTPMLAKRAAQDGLRVYGLGSAEGVAEKALNILKEANPGLSVAGTYSPPYASLLDMDHRTILQRLEQAKPDILFVALGAPKQDKFISMHVRGWNVPVSIGVGASLDFIAEEQQRAPVWAQQWHVEWLWRVCGDPKRLISRYVANVRFLLSASRHMLMIHRMKDQDSAFQVFCESGVKALGERGVVFEPFQPLSSVDAAGDFIDRVSARGKEQHILLDVHAVPWLDSLELGALLELNKLCRSWGKRLILYGLRPKVRRLLDTCRLTDYFDTASRPEKVEAIIQNLVEHADGGTSYGHGVLRLELPIELTAATLPEFDKETGFVHQKLQKNGGLKAVEVDASRLEFIDSSGLGFLIFLKKITQDEGVSLGITHLAAGPRRTFELARVDKVLLHS